MFTRKTGSSRDFKSRKFQVKSSFENKKSWLSSRKSSKSSHESVSKWLAGLVRSPLPRCPNSYAYASYADVDCFYTGPRPLYIYIYIYMCVCVCVRDVCVYTAKSRYVTSVLSSFTVPFDNIELNNAGTTPMRNAANRKMTQLIEFGAKIAMTSCCRQPWLTSHWAASWAVVDKLE